MEIRFSTDRGTSHWLHYALALLGVFLLGHNASTTSTLFLLSTLRQFHLSAQRANYPSSGQSTATIELSLTVEYTLSWSMSPVLLEEFHATSVLGQPCVVHGPTCRSKHDTTTLYFRHTLERQHGNLSIESHCRYPLDDQASPCRPPSSSVPFFFSASAFLGV